MFQCTGISKENLHKQKQKSQKVLSLLPLSFSGCRCPLFSAHQTKQRLKALLCCSSPDWKLLTRPGCVEVCIAVCCGLMLWDFNWGVCATTDHCVYSFDNKVMCNWHQSVKKESQSLMQVRECLDVANWAEQLVLEVRILQTVPNYWLLCVKNREKL